MMNAQAFYIPDAGAPVQQLTLRKVISAILLQPKSEGGAKLGALAQLTPGAVLEICGDGYNERTKKVRAQGQYYFVFKQDIELGP